MYSGLADPVLDGQRVFRAVMDAMAHPGRVSTVPAVATVPEPLSVATVAVGLTLLDFETPLWIDAAASTSIVWDYLRFHSECPVVEKPERARFVLITDPEAMVDWTAFDVGLTSARTARRRSSSRSAGSWRTPASGSPALVSAGKPGSRLGALQNRSGTRSGATRHCFRAASM